MKNFNHKDEEIINYEVMGGWPVCKMNLRDVLKGFGATYNEQTNNWEIPESEKLDVYPRRLTDDGMGYGVDMEYLVEVSLFDDKENNRTYCNIFTEKELNYLPVWKQANTFPGDCFVCDDIEYIVRDIDETDKGFVFICKPQLNIKSPNRVFSLEEIKDIMSREYTM